MTGLATLQSRPSADVYLSENSVSLRWAIGRLLELGRERGLPTALTEAPAILGADTLSQRFESLADQWRRECAHLSSVREMVLHTAYQQIIGMGKDALPFLLRELERRPDHWFWALRAITGEDAVRREHRGNIRLMASDWLSWARTKGLRS